MEILIPTPLRSYTAGQGRVHAEGATLLEVTANLERQFPGIRFRMIDEQGRMRGQHAHLRQRHGGFRAVDAAARQRQSGDRAGIERRLRPAYAIWSDVGVALITRIAWVFFGQSLDTPTRINHARGARRGCVSRRVLRPDGRPRE